MPTQKVRVCVVVEEHEADALNSIPGKNCTKVGKRFIEDRVALLDAGWAFDDLETANLLTCILKRQSLRNIIQTLADTPEQELQALLLELQRNLTTIRAKRAASGKLKNAG